jgi:predicted secreted Zn-dependent protease
MAETELPINEMVAVYRKIRAAIDEREEKHTEAISTLKEQLDTVGNKLLAICNEQNLDSIKTPDGTITRRVTARYWTSDWETMYRFIKENDVPHLLEQRIHNGNMKQFIAENPEAFPAGLQCDRKYVIQIRKPTNK